MPVKFTLQEYERRHRCLLRHAAVYRLLLPHVAAAVFNDGQPLPHVYKKLSDEGLLVGHARQLPGGCSYYVLSPRGCARIGAAAARSMPPQGAAFDLAIAIAHFCGAERHRRYRLDSDEQDKLFAGTMPANVPFLVSDELGETKVFRVVHAVGQTALESVRKARERFEQMSRHPQMAPLLSQQQLGVALLSPTAARLAAVQKAIAHSGLSQAQALVCGVGPDAEHLAAAIKQKGK